MEERGNVAFDLVVHKETAVRTTDKSHKTYSHPNAPTHTDVSVQPNVNDAFATLLTHCIVSWSGVEHRGRQAVAPATDEAVWLRHIAHDGWPDTLL